MIRTSCIRLVVAVLTAAAALTVGVAALATPANAANTSASHAAHVAHMQHTLRALNANPPRHLPVCVEEDGSGQWYCHSGPSAGVKYTARVVKVNPSGSVVRAYRYADGHVEYLTEAF